MISNSLLKYWFAQFTILIFILFLTFSEKEHGDMNVVLFGTMLYAVYIIILTAYSIVPNNTTFISPCSL
ncbi:MAG TPA: hypothetical protein VF411_01205, partial [Bacteroidia bacterium]